MTHYPCGLGNERPSALQDTGHTQILLRRDERPQGLVAYVTINNAQRLNALNTPLMAAFVETMTRLGTEERLRAVVLSGAGPKAFIVGADIGEMAGIEEALQAKAFIRHLHACCEAIRNCPVPVIARIQGYCFGGGLEMAAACDVRIASEAATFGMQEVKLGIPSVIEAALLPTLVGWGRAREIMLLGESFGAAEALAWRLVEHSVRPPALDETVEAWIKKLLTSAPRAVRLQKRLIRKWEELPLAAAVEAGVEAFAEAYAGDEPKIAMRKFLEAQKTRKRVP